VRRVGKSASRLLSVWLVSLAVAVGASAQAVPYARSYAKPKQEVDRALKDLQAYSGQKLPLLDGFVASDKPLDQYERGFYQYSIELLPGDAGATIVRLSAKITAWHVDRDVSKSGYEALASNGRLELDLLDRLQEKLTGKPVDPPATLNTNVQAPRPKLDLSGVPGASTASAPSPVTRTPDEVAAIRGQRVVAERRVQQLTSELDNLKDIQHNQVHPQNLVIVDKPGTAVFDKPNENARELFQAAVNDEFEFLDAANGWIHVTLSGDSRGYIRQSAVLLPERIASKMANSDSSLEQKFPGFRIEQEGVSNFPGDWAVLKGKKVKIYTVQAISQNAKDSGPTARLNYSLALFEQTLKEAASASTPVEGVVVIFDAADGGIVAAAMPDIQKYTSGGLNRDAFWAQAYLDPPDAFRPPAK
jgi:hypothetical protein